MKSKIFSSKYVRTTSKGQLWIPGFILLGCLLAFPVAELLMLGNWFGLNYNSVQMEMLYENLWRDGFVITGSIAAAGAAFMNGVNGFWYLYSSRKVDFFHSLPVERSQIFWHKTYVGVLYYLIPYLAMEFLAVCIGAMKGFFSLKLMGLAIGMLIIHLVFYFTIYFGTVLMISITGNILMGALMEAFFLLYGMVLGLLIGLYKTCFYSTYYPTASGGLENLVSHLSPVYVMGKFIEQYAEKQFPGYFFGLTVMAVLFGLGAYYAYKKRPSECTGKSMVYGWCQDLVKFAVVIPSGMGIGMIFYLIPSSGLQIPWWIFGLILGTFLSHGILEVIFGLDFRRFFSHKIQMFLIGGIVAFCAMIFSQDLFSYDSYLPKYDKLKNINMNLNDLFSHTESTPYIRKDEDGKYVLDASWEEKDSALFQDGQVSRKMYDRLEQIVKGKKNKNGEGISYVNFCYTLNSGRKVYRTYEISAKELESLLYSCYEESTMKEQKFAFLSLDSKYLQWISGLFADGEYYALFQKEPEKAGDLLEALRKDVEEASTEDLLEVPCVSLMFQYENIPVQSDVKRLDENDFYSCSFYVYPSFKRTVAILKETGYPMSVEEVEITEFELTCYGKNGNEEKQIVYTDEEKINELKQVVQPSGLVPFWIPKETGIEIAFCKENDKTNKLYANAWKDCLPEFVKEDLKNQASTKKN